MSIDSECPKDLTLGYDKIMEYCTTANPGRHPGIIFKILRNLQYIFFDRITKLYIVPMLILSQPERSDLLIEFEKFKREKNLNRYDDLFG